jgi:hypothetical protein
VAQSEYDKLGQGLAYDDYLAVQGAYQASVRTLDLVDTLIKKADEIHGRERDDSKLDRDHRAAIGYAHPYR